MKKILLVDNSAVVRNVIKSLFQNTRGVKIYEASSLNEVKELIEKHTFFTIVSNLILPDSPNFEILKLLSEKNLSTIVFSSSFEFKEEASRYKNILEYVLKDSSGYKHIFNLISAILYCYNEEVLVVDDSSTQAECLKNILEKLRLKVTRTENGVTALKILEENHNFKFILSDYEMPNMDGLELLKKIRVHKKYNDTPTIIITNNDTNDLKIEFYKYGANDILHKPILQEELLSKVINIFLNMKQIEDINAFNSLVDKNIITSATDPDGKIITASEAFCEISGYTKEELIGRNHNILRHPDMPESTFTDLWQTIKSGKVWKGEIKNLKKDGGFYWVKAIVEPNFSKTGGIIGFTALRYDITDKKMIEIISITDGLTQIYNRRYFDETFPKIINSAKRKNELVCFLFMDIDHFKQYNDNYGHQKGDEVLINFAKCLKDSLHRAGDLTFRLGGEEFAVVYQTETKEKAIEFANQIKENIENMKLTHEYNSASSYITASMGLICKNANDITDNVYKEADDLLYEAKRNGRNQVRVNP